MKNQLLQFYWFSLLLMIVSFTSCKKGKESPKESRIKSKIIPIREGNYWEYNFYRRLNVTDHATDPVTVRIEIGTDTQLPNSGDACYLFTRFENQVDTTFLVKQGNDLVFYKIVSPVFNAEILRLPDDIQPGQTWLSVDAVIKVDSTTVVNATNTTVPAGNFSTLLLHQRTKPVLTSFFTEVLLNDLWIQPGIGIIKQELLSHFFGYMINPSYYHGRYELTRYHIR